MQKVLRAVALIGVVAALVLGTLFVVRQQNKPSLNSQATVQGLQANGDTSGFAKAINVREFDFPKDYGPHNDFQTEWWYYTGNLTSETGEHFGYQFTIFRRAVTPGDLTEAWSALASNQIYFAHFAITDSTANEHVAFERYSRGAEGLAGASSPPLNVFIQNWRIETTSASGGAEAVRMVAKQGKYEIDLNLVTTKPIVLQGERGLSPKGAEVGNASYYYSFTRMETQGTVKTKRGEFKVRGSSWMDREFSTSALSKNAVGWDWFAIQLDDGRDIKAFQVRNNDGSIDPISTAKIVGRDGSAESVKLSDLKLEALETWRSPATNSVYPVKWRITLLKENIVLDVAARIPNQEMKLSQTYWEGAVTVSGTQNGQPVSGVGYLEMTGYGTGSAEKY